MGLSGMLMMGEGFGDNLEKPQYDKIVIPPMLLNYHHISNS